MRERGIIFNAEMVCAILDGRKTQTRRIMINQPCYLPGETISVQDNGDSYYRWLGEPTNDTSGWFWCPLGKVGDHLWVRETFALLGNEDGVCVDWNDRIVYDEKEAARIYRASCEQKDGDYGLWSIPDDADWKPHTDNHKYDGTWRPSIHMPRWASRILLEITGVRVERLQDISEEDAVAEGVAPLHGGYWKHYQPSWTRHQLSARGAFVTLWNSINGEDAWYKNPWVWVIEFKQIQRGN